MLRCYYSFFPLNLFNKAEQEYRLFACKVLRSAIINKTVRWRCKRVGLFQPGPWLFNPLFQEDSQRLDVVLHSGNCCSCNPMIRWTERGWISPNQYVPTCIMHVNYQRTTSTNYLPAYFIFRLSWTPTRAFPP